MAGGVEGCEIVVKKNLDPGDIACDCFREIKN